MNKKDNDNSGWERENNEVWVTADNCIQPSPYFLKWWQDVAVLQYGDASQWLSIAEELGFVIKIYKNGEFYYEPAGFDYDKVLVHNTLKLPEQSPIIRRIESGIDAHSKLIEMLFNEGKNDR